MERSKSKAEAVSRRPCFLWGIFYVRSPLAHVLEILPNRGASDDTGTARLDRAPVCPIDTIYLIIYVLFDI